MCLLREQCWEWGLVTPLTAAEAGGFGGLWQRGLLCGLMCEEEQGWASKFVAQQGVVGSSAVIPGHSASTGSRWVTQGIPRRASTPPVVAR